MNVAPTELEQYLLRLDLTPADAAHHLGVSQRTVRRWQEGEPIPGPAQIALRAWITLHEHNLPWRADSASLAQGDQQAIDRHRDHATWLAEILKRVEDRGGPRAPWSVDHQRKRAVWGALSVSFYLLANGSFSLSTYTRKDHDPDVERDWDLIEDAVYCIAQEVGDGPVTLVYHNKPWKQGVVASTLKHFGKRSSAIDFACGQRGETNFHDPFITAGKSSHVLMDKLAIKAACEARERGAAALNDIAAYVCRHAGASATDGARMLSPAQAAQKKQKIEQLGAELAELAKNARKGVAGYGDFESLLGQLHKLGFFPETQLVSGVARAFLD